MTEAIIIIKDETNCKIEGLELSDRRALMKKFEFETPGARYLPSVKLGRWNGKTSFFSLAGSTYVNLLDQIIPYLYDKGYDITLDDRRIQHPEFTFELISESTFSNTLWPESHPLAGKPIELREHQVNIINQFLENPQSIVAAATGSGKTLVTAALSKTVEPYGRSIVIVPNKSLVVQTEADYINLGLDVGVYFGDRKDYGKTHTICTWQSLSNVFKNTADAGETPVMDDFVFDDVACVIVDECHTSKASQLKSMLTGPLAHVPLRWGLTGTIPKDPMDKASLLVSIGPVVGELAASELQEKGILAKCHVNIVQLKDKVEFSNYQSELKHLLEDSSRLDKIGELIEGIAETGNTLVLVDRVNAGKELASRIVGSVFVNGNTKLTERKEEYDEVATSDDKVIIATYGVASTGININRIFNLVLIEPGKSFVRVIQSIGRGLRVAEDKEFVNIWDITSTCKFSKRHLTQRKTFYRESNYPFTVNKMDT